MKSFLDADNNFPTLRGLQQLVTSELRNGNGCGAGRWLGGVAGAFGVAAPLCEIAHEIISDCFKGFSGIGEDHRHVYFHCVDGNAELCGGIEFVRICDVDDGIEGGLWQVSMHCFCSLSAVDDS